MSQKKVKRKCIQNSDPGKVLDLVMSLNDEDCADLQVKINIYLTEECEAELVLQVIVNSERMEACIDAVGKSKLPRRKSICMYQIFNEVLKSTSENCELLSNLPQEFQAILNPYLTVEHPKKRVLLCPIPDKPFSMVICVVGSKVLEETVAALVHECFLLVWPTLNKSILYEYERTLKHKCQMLLRVAKRLFSQVASLDTLLKITMEQAKQLSRAEVCVVLLIDMEKMEFIDHQASSNNQERRLPLDKGISGQVVHTGELVNCRNAKEHPAFDPEIDGVRDQECRSLLCFPIRDQSGIIGVGQLINKLQEPYFDGMDEEMALAFSIYCGVCIMHSVVYEKIQEAHVRNALANELVMYHMKVSDAEVSRLLDCTGFHNHPHLSSLHFNPRALPLRELPCYVFKMFTDLGYNKMFKIRSQTLACFILYVKKGYRDVPYHSWLHAFNVGQWAYAMITSMKLVQQGYLTDLQCFMYLVAGLMHDLDHRGTTNSFQIAGQTTLAALYSSEGSVMERHHLAQAVCILNTEGCDLLAGLPRRDYDRAILLLRDYILASDLANYFKNLNEYQTISVEFTKGNRAHISALQALLMNAADLSDQLKDWGSVKKTAASVLTEFFKQGDAEKSRGELPMIMMDREKCFIPDLELQFLTATCIPLYLMLGRIIPKMASSVKIIETHIERWDASKPVFAEVPVTAGLSVLLSPDLDTLIDLNLQEKERLRLEEAGEQTEG